MWEVIESIRLIESMKDAAASADAKVLDRVIKKLQEKFEQHIEDYERWCEWQQQQREEYPDDIRF